MPSYEQSLRPSTKTWQRSRKDFVYDPVAATSDKSGRTTRHSSTPSVLGAERRSIPTMTDLGDQTEDRRDVWSRISVIVLGSARATYCKNRMQACP